ncbi:lipid II flippase MurJ [Bradyrhizobium ottawaense]|uniref:lipid II flippase MurJ n=1 Tax=Bradyrhizobium ottawaense TaxID=931866 RepID=UPI00271462A6|nr:lipid II flippase MurJ [Bradyrhizobium ottawaense]WLB47933.1 lipid II flippase MurJ [Bradyrhizobium ottawaense]
MLRAAVTLLFGNLAAKFTGILREVIFAALFGVSELAAAYRVAYSGFYIPIHALVGETLSTNVIPVFRNLSAESPNAARAFSLVLVAHCVAVGALIAFFLLVGRAWIVDLIAPGLGGSVKDLAGTMLVMMALASPMYILGNALASLEATRGRYSGVSLRPFLLNAIAIAAAVVAWKTNTPLFLAWGIFGGHAVFLLWTLYSTRQLGLLSFRTCDLETGLLLTGCKALWRNSAPLLLFPVVGQLAILVERIVASKVGPSVLPSTDYARAIAETFVTLTAVPLSFASLASHGGSRTEQGRSNAIKASGLLLVLAFPAGLFLALNAAEIVHLVFARGEFGRGAVETTAQILFGMALGLGPWAAGYYLLRVLNSELRNGAATSITIAGSASMVLFDVTMWPYFGAATIGLGASLSGLTIFVGAMSALKLWLTHLRLVVVLLLMGAVFSLMSRMLPAADPMEAILLRLPLLGLFMSAILFDASARSALAPLTKQIPFGWSRK